MNKRDLRKLAIKQLNSKKVKTIKKQICEQIIDINEQQNCMTAFDNSFIQSFIQSRTNVSKKNKTRKIKKN